MEHVKYNPQHTEEKWQKAWKDSGIFKADLEGSDKPKYYNLVMFPYPSGDKLHIGHWYNYAPVDSWGRYMKMKGHDVFQPMGFDSFGLPAENYAIKTGVHPAETTRTNIDKMKEQIAAIGGMYDLDLEVETSSPEYYKWTQWLFLQLYKKDLAYRKAAPVNWCNSCQTVLANEQVDNGHCERCNNEVIQKKLTQWFFKITDYADKLLDYSEVDWPQNTIAMQRNWIGRSEGAELSFKVDGMEENIEVFTTRPDTLFGATYMVISPENPLVEKLTIEDQKTDVAAYQKAAKSKSEMERTELNKDKSGVFTGSYAINPVNGEKIPVWIADYVLMTYGTGAIMAVPAHDERDHEFAKRYEIRITEVVEGGENIQEKAFTDNGLLVNSEFLNGLKVKEAKLKMIEWLNEKKLGSKTVNFRLRDWLVSRQRYWGAPIPIIHCVDCGEVAVPEADLPVVHPHVEDYVPKGKSPLADSDDFVNVDCPSCGKPAKREVDTMDTFVCSSWYYLRYPDSMNTDLPWKKDRADKWLPVDMYVGGPEHACMHLLYARFIHKVMNEMGLVDHKEPFKRLVHQGMITKDGAKMSKSKGNSVSPDEFVEKYGSDVFRMYLMFMGPFDQGGDWNDKGITGVARFVDRLFRVMKEAPSGEGMDATVHKAVKRASDAIEKMAFNIVIATLMELTNDAMKNGLSAKHKDMIIRVLAPVAPHLAEEMWEMTRHEGSVFNAEWPVADESLLVEDTVTYGIQVNGKLRGTIDLAKDVEKSTALEAAKAMENVAKFLEGEIVKEIFVPGRIIGFVVKG
ncbi:MAG: leucyl-tRNA synthetase [Oceanicoccus sp.]|jgi:leucyl-tRNA synthetase